MIIDNLLCQVYNKGHKRIAYILAPMPTASSFIEGICNKYEINIVVIQGMDWDNDLTPWPAKGVPAGSSDFSGNGSTFLKTLSKKVIPSIETALGGEKYERTLVGISLSGLFTLWEWLDCDYFDNIACLSGSFWYKGFVNWVETHKPVSKSGKAVFLLGNLEHKTKVPQFQSIDIDTANIIRMLKRWGNSVSFISVPGNHYQDGLERLEKAFAAIYADTTV